MVWLQPTSGEAQASTTVNRFETHVQDIYNINNTIKNVSVQNIAMSMSFLNSLMVKVADVESRLHTRTDTLLSKQSTLREHHDTERVKEGAPTAQAQNSTPVFNYKTIKNTTELTRITANDVVALSKDTINNLSTIINNSTAHIENNAPGVTYNLPPTEIVHEQKPSKEAQAEELSQVILHSDTVQNTITNTVKEQVQRQSAQTEPVTQGDKPIQSTTQKPADVDTQSAQPTQDVFTAATLQRRPTRQSTAQEAMQRPQPHYRNNSIQTQRQAEAPIVYDASGRVGEKQDGEGTISRTSTDITVNKIVNESVKSALQNTDMPTKSTAIERPTEPAVRKVFTSADVTVKQPQTEQAAVATDTIKRIHDTTNILGRTVSEITHAREIALQSVAPTQNITSVQNDITHAQSTTNVDSRQQLNSVQNIVMPQAVQTVHADNRQAQTEQNAPQGDTHNNVFNINSLKAIQNAKSVTNSNTQQFATSRTDIHNLQLSPVQQTVLQSIKHVGYQNTNIFGNTVNAAIAPSNGVAAQPMPSEMTLQQGTAPKSMTSAVRNVAVPEVGIVFKPENTSETRTQSAEQQEILDDIVTIKKTVKKSESVQNETVTNVNVQDINKKNHTVTQVESGKSVKLGSAQIANIADRVYKQLETRLRNERYRRGM